MLLDTSSSKPEMEQSLNSLNKSFGSIGKESIDEALHGLAKEKNYDLLNKWRMRILSILNTRMKVHNYHDYKLDIHTNYGWVNPDDLSANTVIVSYMPVVEKVKIQIIMNEENPTRDATQNNSVDINPDDGVVQVEESKTEGTGELGLVAERLLTKDQAKIIFNKFDWNMDKLIDHIYLNTTAKGAKLIKLADPAQVKKIMYHNTIEVSDQRMHQT